MRTTALLLLMIPMTSYGDGGFGQWSTVDGKKTLNFGANNEIWVWVQGSDKRMVGAWEFQNNICWVGDKNKTYGNSLLYFDGLECCVGVQFLSKKLVMTYVWSKGYDRASVCSTAVLSRDP